MCLLPLQGPITPHTIVTLPNSNGMQLLLCYDNEGVYVNTYGKVRNSAKYYSKHVARHFVISAHKDRKVVQCLNMSRIMIL